MTPEERLYENMGELLYVIAKADGVIQDEELDVVKEILKDHKWAEEIKWSFIYEASREHSIEDIYKKVITSCHMHGPSPIYAEFIDAMNKVAAARNGIDKDEQEKIDAFSKDLISRFQKDIDDMESR